MFYQFPVGLTLAEVRDVVNRHNERCGTKAFIEADRESHVIFNYVVAFADSFPQPNTGDAALDREYAILRECRGLIMSKETGRVIARRYQKFFNVNEKPETQMHLVDWTRPHSVLQKLDGSMITPFVPDGAPNDLSGIRFGTKMGATDVARPVEEFVKKHPQYAGFCHYQFSHGFTPIFEWCSRQQKIVVDYPDEKLVLTAIRNIETGEYVSHAEMVRLGSAWSIPVVKALPGTVENIQEFMTQAQDLEGAEGYVIRFDCGAQLKVKGAWYCRIHGTKDLIQNEKNVWALILEERLDDAKAFMDDADRDRVERFEKAFHERAHAAADRLQTIVDEQKAMLQDNKKRFALEFAPTVAKNDRQLLFAIWDGQDPVKAVLAYLSKHYSTGTRVDEARPMLSGLRWDDYRDTNVQLDD